MPVGLRVRRIGFNILKEQFEIKPQLTVVELLRGMIGFNILKEQFEIKPQPLTIKLFTLTNWF